MSEELEKCRKDVSPENFLELAEKANKIPKHLMVAHLKKKEEEIRKYDDTIKNFAISLRLKSKSAYRYLRSCYGDSLPHERTIQRWCSVVDASPGFNQSAMAHLSKKVEEYRQKEKSLLCSLTLDEMALKKYIEFTGNMCLFLYENILKCIASL